MIESLTGQGISVVHACRMLDVVLAGLRGDVTVKELCRSHEIAEALTGHRFSVQMVWPVFAGLGRLSDRLVRPEIASG